MPDTKRPTPSEKGLFTPDNCVVAMIDLQPQMLFGVVNFDRAVKQVGERIQSANASLKQRSAALQSDTAK